MNAKPKNSFAATARIVTALVVLSSGAEVKASTFLTTANDGTALARIDTNTGASTIIGPTGFSGTYGLAVDNSTGAAYGIVNSSQLATFNLTTGAATVIGNLGVPDYNLEIAPNGTLYAAALNNNLYTINRTTGAATLVGSMGTSCSCTMDIAFAPDGTLYGTDSGRLYRINLATGAATTVTFFGYSNVMGIAFDSGGTLYATGYESSGALYTINPTTGAILLVGATGLYYEHGGDILLAAVPEPSTWAMMILGFAAVGFMSYRKRRIGLANLEAA